MSPILVRESGVSTTAAPLSAKWDTEVVKTFRGEVVSMWRRLLAFLVASVVVEAALIGPFAVAGAHAATKSTRTVTVTLADNGHRYRLHKGDLLDVQLSGPSYAVWAEPSSSNSSVLERSGGSPGSVATATFIAEAKGTAKVTDTATLVCPSVCAGPALPGFAVKVSVSG